MISKTAAPGAKPTKSRGDVSDGPVKARSFVSDASERGSSRPLVTTVEEVVDLGDGRKKIIRTTKQESIEEAPSSSSSASPEASAHSTPQRNMFKNLRIVVGSAGEMPVSRSTPGSAGSSPAQPQTFYFRDFDDLVDRIDQARLKLAARGADDVMTRHVTQDDGHVASAVPAMPPLPHGEFIHLSLLSHRSSISPARHQ